MEYANKAVAYINMFFKKEIKDIIYGRKKKMWPLVISAISLCHLSTIYIHKKEEDKSQKSVPGPKLIDFHPIIFYFQKSMCKQITVSHLYQLFIQIHSNLFGRFNMQT